MIGVEVSAAASADLDEVFDFGFERFGQDAAEAYVRRFQDVYDLIRDFPLSGSIHDRVRPPIRSLPCGNHRVYYDVIEDRVIVRRILHRAMDVERHL